MDDTSGRVDPGGRDVAGRATETTRGYAADERNDSDEQRTREIRHEIEETRGEMSETIDAIQEKLKPGNIVANATDRVKSAATERVRDMADTASHTAQQAMDYTREQASGVVGSARQNPIPLALIGVGAAWLLSTQARRSASYDRPRYARGYDEDDYLMDREWEERDDSGFMGKIRNNPIPTALAGIGLGWLAFSGGEREHDYRRYAAGRPAWRTADEETERWRTAGGERGTAANVTDSASQVASRTKEYASETAQSMKRMARRRQNQVQRMAQESPLLVGAGALMLGAAFGLAIPETETENEWMGDTRDTMVDRARDMARDAANDVQEAAGTVADAAKKITGKAQS